MPEMEASHDDIPDSATTAKESLFQDILLRSDGTIRKDKEEDLEVDPLDRAPTALDDDAEEKGDNSNDFGGDGALDKTVSQAREWWKFRLRPPEDDEPE